MHIVKSFIIAFSIYSRIPVPQFEWKEEDMKYVLCFFPWIGAVIGACVYLWNRLCSFCSIGEICRVSVGMAIPLLVTGGFHVDGFMDTMDAFHSYQPKEKKLEILKDAHIGAFAVIMLVLYGMLYMGAFSEVKSERILSIVCSGFFLSRCLSGISVVSFPLAKKEGMLTYFAESSQKNVVRAILGLQMAGCIGVMLYRAFPEGIFAVITVGVVFGYYYRRCKKEFGGITGDTAGYFVVICEICMMGVAAGLEIIKRM